MFMCIWRTLYVLDLSVGGASYDCKNYIFHLATFRKRLSSHLAKHGVNDRKDNVNVSDCQSAQQLGKSAYLYSIYILHYTSHRQGKISL